MDQIIKENGLSESAIVEKSKEHHRSANRSWY
jgi:hypothetical protein